MVERMKVFGLCCLIACIALIAGCSTAARNGRPHVYRGGQDYEGAVHASSER